ncbi:constitutive coactivator of peroxisome proliferator-activated receptor gamma isoform X3 [Opisthocomus hoazin]|uniref:constitutive coactivator of peroxisome proliferator-activated receptor gamma isoform X3 n=1 Tax=Opisthocomus hoazin TaxID=30419 RepID=UPI003F530BA7
MGIKGLQGFVAGVCPDACRTVDLREMAEKHRVEHPDFPPVIVVDAMSCVRHWYTPETWVCGGQWREYLASLENFIKVFMAAGIKLVFYFDGVVEEKKRNEWIKRRLQNNKEIARIFQFIKTHRKQPGREMFVVPSALPTFTRFALKSLGQKTVCTLQEADFEVAAYGLQHNCVGILGQDSDYLIYNTCPYFSIEKLRLDTLVTVMYSREDLCRALGLSLTHLPLFACLLGNDVVPESLLEGFWHKCLVTSPHKKNSYSRRANILLAVADYISKVPCSYSSLKRLEEMLPLGSDKTLLCRGVESYLLPGQQSPWIPPDMRSCQMVSLQQQSTLCQDKEIFQLAKEQHIQSENYSIFNILCNGGTECSNSLEDECDREIPGQALIYRPARQHIYAVLLESGKGGAYPLVKEWFVYFGNPLQQPELIQPVQPSVPGGTPNLKTLWFAKGPDVEKQRYSTFLACFHLEDGMEELQALEAPVAAFCCLLAYLMMQLAQVDSRAVHLGAVFVRGLTTLLMANSACGFPFRMEDLMPWEVFDGKLFQEKYQQSHQGCSLEELLEGNESLYAPFQNLKSLICKACMAKKRTIQSRPRGSGFFTGTQQREFNPRFQQTHRSSFVPPYHNQMRGFLWRNPQPQGRQYESGHPDRRRRFHLPPRSLR